MKRKQTKITVAFRLGKTKEINAYVVMLKDTIQEILDAQKID